MKGKQPNVCSTENMFLSNLQIHMSKLQGIFNVINFAVSYHIFEIMACSSTFTAQKGR